MDFRPDFRYFRSAFRDLFISDSGIPNFRDFSMDFREFLSYFKELKPGFRDQGLQRLQGFQGGFRDGFQDTCTPDFRSSCTI